MELEGNPLGFLFLEVSFFSDHAPTFGELINPGGITFHFRGNEGGTDARERLVKITGIDIR